MGAPYPAAIAFDRIAERYDEVFTRSLIGRAQRHAVWRCAARTFAAGDHILELNCGTGADALFLYRMGITVTACDASPQMILQAKRRCKLESAQSAIRFETLPTEQLAELDPAARFDGVFSNFSGLNCVADLGAAAEELARRVVPGSPLLLCFSTRVCLWEVLWFLSRGSFRKAFRRWRAQTTVRFEDLPIVVHYPTVKRLRSLFFPHFTLRSCTGIGVAVPPSYLEPWARRHPGILRRLSLLDRVLCTLPVFRVLGDHMLLCFERVQP